MKAVTAGKSGEPRKAVSADIRPKELIKTCEAV